MKSPLTDRCILVTGASSGLGKAVAERLSEQGNFVIASGRDPTRLNELVFSAKGRLTRLTMDVADDESIAKAKEKLNGITDYLDMVICCAGVCEYEDDLQFDPRMYQRVFDVNVLGVIKTLNMSLPLLRNSQVKNPRIVLVGSLSSLVGFPRAEAYGASKAAIQYLAESLMTDTAKSSLKVSLVRPGFVHTPMTESNDFPMPFSMTADRAAEYIVRGLERGHRFIDFPSALSWPLILASKIKWFWLSYLAPRLSRHQGQQWRA